MKLKGKTLQQALGGRTIWIESLSSLSEWDDARPYFHLSWPNKGIQIRRMTVEKVIGLGGGNDGSIRFINHSFGKRIDKVPVESAFPFANVHLLAHCSSFWADWTPFFGSCVLDMSLNFGFPWANPCLPSSSACIPHEMQDGIFASFVCTLTWLRQWAPLT